jgi:uncharacterized spore protein YtfJ
MNIRETFDALADRQDASQVYGQPHESGDGTTVIPVAKVRGRSKPGGDGLRVMAKPVGVFVIKDGNASWEPAVDATRIAVMGLSVGLLATALAGIAMVRRPPWPDLHGDVSRKN